MPWFKIDDSSYSHPKFVRAGNAALGLWVRCGAYSAQHLLEGRVPGFIAKSFGTSAQAQKLVAVGLWHGAGHDCPRCPQPGDGDFIIHDFFEGGRNSTRAQVEASRKGAAERQARARARAAAKAAAEADTEAAEQKPPPNRNSNGEQFDSESETNRTPNEPWFPDSAAGQEGSSQRDGLTGVTPSLAMPRHKKLASSGERRIPTWAEPLIDELSRKDIHVGWGRLTELQWIAVQQLIRTHGVPYLVHIAANRWNPANPIRFGSLLLDIWQDYPTPAEGSRWRPRQPLPAMDIRPHCGDLECDEATRLRDIVRDGLPELMPCPKCHPNTRGVSA